MCSLLHALTCSPRPGHSIGWGLRPAVLGRSPTPRTCSLPRQTNVRSRVLVAPAHTLRQYDSPPRPRQDLERLVLAVEMLPSTKSSSVVQKTSHLLWCFADWARQSKNSRAHMTQAQCNAVLDLLQRVAGWAGTAGNPHVLIQWQQVNAERLSMAAWSLGKLRPHLPAAAITSACAAIASHSASSEAMKNGRCRDWSNLLHGLATAGMQCSSSPDLTRLCDQAVQLLPDKLPLAADQAIHMTLWAMAKSGYTGSAQPLLRSVTAAISQGEVMADAKPQTWVNLIWAASKLPGCKKEARQLLSLFAVRAQALVPGLDAQCISNILHAMGLVLWHDKEVCRQLAERAAQTQRYMNGQAMASNLYALARLGYLDSSVRSLAAGVAKADLTTLEPLQITYLLYARSMFLALSIHQAVSSGHSQLASEPQLNSMAAALWRECSRRGQSEELWGKENLTHLHDQLYSASLWLHASTGGQTSLSASPALQELLAKAKTCKKNEVVKLQTILKGDSRQLVRALVVAGHCEVQQTALSQDGTYYTELLVRDPRLERGIAIKQDLGFLHDGSMSGVVAHAKLLQLTHFDAGVMVNKESFYQLASKSERAVYMHQQVQASLPEAEAWRQLLQAEERHSLRPYEQAPRRKQDLWRLVLAVEMLPFTNSSSVVQQTSHLLWCFADWAKQPEDSRSHLTQAQCNAVLDLLQCMAVKTRAGTAGYPLAPLQQYDARQLSMAAWSLGKLRPHLPAAAVTSACTALASHSASTGMQCSSSPDLTRLYNQAVQLLPNKLPFAADQAISMTLWAMAKSGYTGSAQPLLQSVAAAISQARAQAMCQHLKPIDISNILYSMGLVLWHDKEVCRQLAERAAQTQNTMNGQAMANSLYALARLGYLDSSVRNLAAGVAKADLTTFKPQQITNLLYARSMFLALSVHQAVSSGHSQLASEPQLNSMAAALWRECSRRGQSEELWGKENLTQLYTASQWLHACTGRQTYMAASPALHELLDKAAACKRSIIAKRQTVFTEDCSQHLLEALAAAGHAEVQQAVISQDGTCCTWLLVQEPGLTQGTSFDLSDKFLHDGSMSGVVALVKLHQLAHFDAAVVVNSKLFYQLASDSERAAFMREQVQASLPEAEAWRQLLQAEGRHCAGQGRPLAAATPAAQQQQAASVSAGQQARQQGALPLPAAQAKSAGALPSQRAAQAQGLMPRPVRPRVWLRVDGAGCRW
ncbi:hypothetical protein QJQ45_015112 [Haematococcus lacustris]|nr:hypothetical protein QJQ45_015112 [Haematococcus lacustris]